MMADNQWHDCIIYQHSDDGSFELVDTLEEAKEDLRPKITVNCEIKYDVAKYNWNHGQPRVKIGDFEMTIVDFDSK